MTGGSVDGARLTTIVMHLRATFHELGVARLLTHGGWDEVASSVKVWVYHLMRLLCPEVQFCQGNWKTDYLCRAVLSGWWQNHGHKFVPIHNDTTSVKNEETPSSSPNLPGTIPPSTTASTDVGMVSATSSALKRARTNSNPESPLDPGTSDSSTGQAVGQDGSNNSGPTIKKARIISRRPQVHLFPTDVTKGTESIDLEGNQASSTNRGSTASEAPPISNSVGNGASHNETVASTPALSGSTEAATPPQGPRLQERLIPATMANVASDPAKAQTGPMSGVMLTGPGIQTASTSSSEPTPSTLGAPALPPVVTANAAVKRKATAQPKPTKARRPAAPKDRNKTVKITGDASHPFNIARAEFIRKGGPKQTVGQFYDWAKGLSESEWLSITAVEKPRVECQRAAESPEVS
ncbi:hypothetical protein V5O48_013250 [Marasmius crinis-equi]|uniref:Uncharacterized protein n=1 Tax=Marasmius crinis-equi TaxID=585013 RepID=A0ABR3F0L3_9AGAR